MKTIVIVETIFAVVCQLVLVFLIGKIYYTHGMKSVSWVIIGISFIILLIKWIFGVITILHILRTQYAIIIYETLTDVFAIVILIGFYLLYRDLNAGERFTKSSSRSLTISRNIIE